MKKLLLLVIPAMMLWNNNTNAQTALEFDRVDDYVDAGSNFNLSNYTLEAWVYWDGESLPNENNVIIGGGDNNPHFFWIVNGFMYTGINNKEFVVVDEQPMPVGEWIHFAVTYEGATGNMRMYRNGVITPFGSTNSRGDSGFVLTELNIGRNNNPVKQSLFGGMIDDVRVWDYVRSAEEIADNYESCLTGTESGLVAFYDMEDGSGSNVASDLTGNGNDGTLVNMDVDNSWVDGYGSCGEEEPEPECIEITSFYPNPTWNKVYLNLNASYNSMQVRVYNQWGYYVRGKYVCGPLDKVNASLYGLSGGRYYYVMVIDCETWKYDYVRVYKRSWC